MHSDVIMLQCTILANTTVAAIISTVILKVNANSKAITDFLSVKAE